jgi:hypothetical protein
MLSGVLVPLAAGVAQAQVTARVLGGVTSAAETNPFLGGAIAGRIGWIEIDVEGGRMFDILPSGVLDRLNELQRDQGLPVEAIAKLPANYVLGQVRVVARSGPVQPFVGGGIGFARLEPRFDVTVAGISLGDVFGLTSVDPVTKPMAAVSGGLRVALGDAAHIDLGYRYLRIFSDFGLESGLGGIGSSGRTNINSVYGAVGIKF